MWNQGTQDAGPFALEFFLSQDQNLDSGDLLIWTKHLKRVRAGRMVQIKHRIKNVEISEDSAGFLIAVADREGRLDECALTDNVASSTPID